MPLDYDGTESGGAVLLGDLFARVSWNTNLATDGPRPALHECVVQGVLQADWRSLALHDRIQEPKQRAQRSSEQAIVSAAALWECISERLVETTEDGRYEIK